MHDSPWQRQLTDGARSVGDLAARGLIRPEQLDALGPVGARFEVLVPDHYLRLVDPSDPACPIRLQAVPDLAELASHPAEVTDPIGDGAHSQTPILVHRYRDRALLFPTLRCPMMCRHCFRKVRLNDGQAVSLRADLPEALAYLRAHPEVREVILSGGDPLMLTDRRLDELLASLRAVPSVKMLRLHTRALAALPQRFGEGLGQVLRRHRPVTLVAHINHARELTPESDAALDVLAAARVPVLAQTVLLRGVNDRPDVLEALLRGLYERGVLPYYVHHPDLVLGTGHLRVSIDAGLELMRSLRGRLPGAAIPTYVIDIPGGRGKIPLDSAFAQRIEPGLWRLRSPLGGDVEYLDPAHSRLSPAP